MRFRIKCLLPVSRTYAKDRRIRKIGEKIVEFRFTADYRDLISRQDEKFNQMDARSSLVLFSGGCDFDGFVYYKYVVLLRKHSSNT